MKKFIELAAVRIGAAIQIVGAKVDFEVLSLPGGSLIAVLLWLYASIMGSIRHAAIQVRASRTTTGARCGVSDRSFAAERLTPPIGTCVGCRCCPRAEGNTGGKEWRWAWATTVLRENLLRS
jgi:hypothetical protein